MTKLSTEFNTRVMVPDWEYCNIHRKEDPNRITNDYCNFISKLDGDYYCKLFQGAGLYHLGHKVLKCDKCLLHCKADGDNG